MLEKKRCLLVGIEAGGAKKLTGEEAKALVYEAVFSLLGEEGAARANVQLKEFSGEKQKLILKCANKQVDAVIAALAAKTEFRGSRLAIRLERISGMIGKLI